MALQMLDGSTDPSVLCALLGRFPGGNAGILGSLTPSGSAHRDTSGHRDHTRPIAMTDTTTAWDNFVRSSRLRPPRELLRRTLGAFLIEGRPPGVAVDLGCGSGPDAAELLRLRLVVSAVED